MLLNIAETLPDCTSEMEKAIEATCWGRSSWKEVVEVITKALPGSFAELMAWDVATNRVTGLTQEFAWAGVQYEFWSRLQSGTGLCSGRGALACDGVGCEEHCGLGAWTGIKINVSSDQRLILTVNYPERLRERYDALAARLLTELEKPLERAFALATKLSDLAGAAASAAAMVNCGEVPALVVDNRLRLIDANKAAAEALFKTGLLRASHGRITVSHEPLSEYVAEAVESIANLEAPSIRRYGCLVGDQHWMIGFTRLPPGPIRNLLPQRPQILITMKDVAARRRTDELSQSLNAFTSLYNLTATEARLCMSIAVGDSLARAADKAGITYEHARQRIKLIFQKTQTSKQSELCVLLARFTG